jgi:transcriptional regulator with XRE-family HTH domain
LLNFLFFFAFLCINKIHFSIFRKLSAKNNFYFLLIFTVLPLHLILMNSNTPSLSSKLRAARVALNLTQAVIAEKLGISQKTYSRWEIGAEEIPKKNLEAICTALGISIASLAEAPQDLAKGLEQMRQEIKMLQSSVNQLVILPPLLTSLNKR